MEARQVVNGNLSRRIEALAIEVHVASVGYANLMGATDSAEAIRGVVEDGHGR